MSFRALPILLLAMMAMSGCISDSQVGPMPNSDVSTEPIMDAPQILEWIGHTAVANLDMLAHMKDPEGVIYPVQQAGFLVDIPEVPTAIEVMVSWEGNGGYMLHPHYTAENDEALGGDTLYYGYMSEMFSESPGCIRIPAADMAAGTWPMMIHPSSSTRDSDYTITVGIVGATGTIPDKMHGHRSDGDSPVEDHGVEPCEFLGQPAEETPTA